MTGRDLIVYILENGLEDEPLFENGKLIGFMSVDEVAYECCVGRATVKAWVEIGKVPSLKIGDMIFIPKPPLR